MAYLQDPDSSTADIDIDDSPTTSSIAATPKRSCEDMSNWRRGFSTLLCLSKLTPSQKANDYQGSNDLFPFKEFRPGISLIPSEELIKINPQYGDLRADYPWTEGLDPIAPEEEDIPVPCAFTAVLAMMAMTEAEQMETFYNLMETHIDPEYAKATNIIQFMKDEGIIVFTNLKQNWDGIQGCDTAVRTQYVLHVTSPVSLLTQTVQYTQYTLSVHHTLL